MPIRANVTIPVTLLALGLLGLSFIGAVPTADAQRISNPHPPPGAVPEEPLAQAEIEADPMPSDAAPMPSDAAPMPSDAAPMHCSVAPLLPGSAPGASDLDLHACAPMTNACLRRTPLEEVELAEVLYEGHRRIFGRPPAPGRLACAWAHCALETSRGVAMVENNVGNITSPVAAPGQACFMRVYERYAVQPDSWQPTDLWFRTFPSAIEGAEAYWSLLLRRYYSTILLCDEGDIAAAAHRLSELGYFTAPAGAYSQAMSRLYFEARGRVIPALWRKRRALAASENKL